VHEVQNKYKHKRKDRRQKDRKLGTFYELYPVYYASLHKEVAALLLDCLSVSVCLSVCLSVRSLSVSCLCITRKQKVTESLLGLQCNTVSWWDMMCQKLIDGAIGQCSKRLSLVVRSQNGHTEQWASFQLILWRLQFISVKTLLWKYRRHCCLWAVHLPVAKQRIFNRNIPTCPFSCHTFWSQEVKGRGPHAGFTFKAQARISPSHEHCHRSNSVTMFSTVTVVHWNYSTVKKSKIEVVSSDVKFYEIFCPEIFHEIFLKDFKNFTMFFPALHSPPV